MIDIIDESGLSDQLTPMGTIIEGAREQVTAAVIACFKAMQTDRERIGTHIKIDYRAGPGRRIKSTIDAVEK